MSGGPIATSVPVTNRTRTVVVHATGFCKETLQPLVDELETIAGDCGVVAVDGRGHGASTPHDGPFDWASASDDIAAVVGRAECPVVGIGHSWGGGMLARVEALHPGSFTHLVLIEPIILPPPYWARDIPLSVGAERRRRSFPDRDAAMARFASGPFETWDGRALDAYIDHAFVETADGWTLRCLPEVEAEVYRQGSNVDTWDRLDAVRCVVSLLAGETSTTHADPYLSLLAGRFPNASVRRLSGLGHLAPMEGPHAVAAVVHEELLTFGTLPTIG